MYLNTHSYYSLRYGVMSVKRLLETAVRCGHDTIALTDINTTSACLDFVRRSTQFGIRPVLGIDFRNGQYRQYVGIARNNEGFSELNAFLSAHLHSGEAFPEQAPQLSNAYFIYPWANFSGKTIRENEYLGVSPADLFRFKRARFSAFPEKVLAFHTATFSGTHKDFNTHRLLRAIDNNTLLSKLPQHEEGDRGDVMHSREEMLQLYEAFPHLIENTMRLLDACSIQFEFGEGRPHKNQKTYLGSEEEDYAKIESLCYEGLSYRYPNGGEKIHERLRNELEIIRQKGFLSYFLINWDITRYARHKNYFYVGRGSGANSLVAYLLRITDVDPIELDLYFERFINLYRKNPPDFDIDFSWRDRDDVTAYIFKTFPHTALLATYNTFKYRAVIRELGKVFGLPKHEIDVLSDGKHHKVYADEMAQLVLKYGRWIEEFPSHLSIHAGGIIISEQPISAYSATFMPPKGYPTTQFDMVIAEDVGLYKFDILSQRGLGKIRDALEVISDNHPTTPPIDIHDIQRFKQDEKIKSLLKNARAIGCFYVESPAMRMLLKKLKVDDYLGLVAASSVIRPGVAKSGMMREYILRFRYPEKRKEAHPVMMEIMPDTFGVMVYQEDVIKVAHYFAGLTLGEADMLRRGMSGKFRSREEFQKVKQQFFSNCRERGHDDKLTSEIWRQVESFAGYAFAKGHSASYAVESYQSLFLKAHYPLEYMVATINNFGGFYRTELYVHEARMHGATIEAPCVNNSDMGTIIYGTCIYLGFGLVKDLETRTIVSFVKERIQGGKYNSVEDFVSRVPVSLEQLRILVRVGAFRFTGKSKKALMWDAHFLLGHTRKSKPEKSLFVESSKHFKLPELYTAAHEEAFEQMELIGFPLGDPFDLIVDQDKHKEVLSVDLELHLGKEVHIKGYLVTAKNTTTSGGKQMYFGTFLDRKGHFLDTVHFPQVAAGYPFRGRGIYGMTGKVVEEFGFYSIEVRSMQKEPMIEDPRYAENNEYKNDKKFKPDNLNHASE